MGDDKPNTELTDADKMLIGSLIVVWNKVELQFDALVLQLLNVSAETLEAIMGSPNVAPRADILIAVAKEKILDEALRQEVISCANRVKGLSNFRNSVVHGRWSFNVDESIPASRKKLLRGEVLTMKQVETEFPEIQKLHFRIADLHWRLLSLGHPSEFALPSPWHGKF